MPCKKSAKQTFSGEQNCFGKSHEFEWIKSHRFIKMIIFAGCEGAQVLEDHQRRPLGVRRMNKDEEIKIKIIFFAKFRDFLFNHVKVKILK